MCRSMVDIQSATADIRRGKNKKERGKKIETTAAKYNVRICYAGRPQVGAPKTQEWKIQENMRLSMESETAIGIASNVNRRHLV